MERKWKKVARSHSPGGYTPRRGDRVRITIESVVSDPISDYGIQFRNLAGNDSHTVYLNQDDVTIEVEVPPKPEVYSHIVATSAALTRSLCGKVWKPTMGVQVVGKCPECQSLAQEWVA